MTSGDPVAPPTHARSDRFRPTRAGIINLWDYVDEEFVFADGRLVLRGANGSGKTKALEVLFPFVLDGSIDARRLDPFSGEERTMKSNLLYRGQDASYGYVWIEFTRTDEDGNVLEAVTVGVGMLARKHETDVTRWYFVTDGRVGVDFGLLTRNDEPVSKKQLTAMLGEEAVIKGAKRYRSAVDTRLFGLGLERYTQMVDLLLQLRRPLLAKDLDPAKVSDTLSAGLRPLDENLIKQAAQSFDDLEGVQRELDTLAAVDLAVQGFLTDYRTYLQAHTRARLHAISQRADTVAGTARELARDARTVHDLDRRISQAEQQITKAGLECSRLTGHLTGLKNLDAYHQHGGLLHLRERVSDTTRHVGRAREALHRHDQQTTQINSELTESLNRLDRHSQEAGAVARQLLDAVQRAGIVWDGDPLTLDGDIVTLTKSRAATRAADIRAVRAELLKVAEAKQARNHASESLSAAEAQQQIAESELASAQDSLSRLRAEAHQALADWARHWASPSDTGPTVVDDDHQSLAQAIDRIGEPGAADLPATFDTITRDRRDDLGLRAHQLDEESQATRKELLDEQARRDNIAAERDEAPLDNGLRQASRADRPGGPLWRLVRFQDHVDDTTAAGIEAALHSAGLLTAWIHPDTATPAADLVAQRHDNYLLPLPPEDRPTGRTLADMLSAEDDIDVDASTIEAILASIAVAEHPDSALATAPAPAVTPHGVYVQGVQAGALTKPTPEYIGPTARAARRAARLAECDATIARISDRLQTLANEHRAVNDALKSLVAARQALPPTRPLAQAARTVDTASGKIAGTRQAVAGARAILDKRTALVSAADRRLRQVADEHAMPTDPQLIATVEQGLDDFLTAGPALHNARRRAADTTRDVAGRREVLARHEGQREALNLSLQQEEATLTKITAELDAAEAAHGPEAAAVAAQVSQTEKDLRLAEQEHEKAKTEHTRHRLERAAASQALLGQEKTLTSAVEETCRELLTLGPYTLAEFRPLLDVASTQTWPVQDEWPDPALIAAQVRERIEELVSRSPGSDTADSDAPTVDINSYLPDPARSLLATYDTTLTDRIPSPTFLQQSASRLSTALHDLSDHLTACEQDYRLEWDQIEGLITVRVADTDGLAPIAVFAGRLATRLAEQEILLNERERAVLEDGILTGIAAQIHSRTVAARDLVQRMDAATTSRRMSSGATVGISWVLANNLSDAQRAVATILKKDAAHLGPEDLAALRGHFRTEIHAARARDRAQRDRRKSYQQLLTEVLDYRAWRTFRLKLIRPGGAEEELTKSRHSVLSGGEKSASIHLPLFAAANAQYASALPTCPRLIALDEAFAGIDDKYKPDLMGLTVAFDLDVIATGHDLWLTYPTVPAVAHYDLHHDEIAHAVSCMLLLWDGGTLHADDGHASSTELATTVLGMPPTRHVPAPTLSAHPLGLDDEDDFDDPDEATS
ncbi:TIGR02680 family protein [Salinispora pacifica]|uniref:TIGR02680 family protein n=1 Tax=Salinispora pacifica TaxID=351187 RepID=UPI00048899A8|nr:TIGR02680 family protein [Salinispora pacifica]